MSDFEITNPLYFDVEITKSDGGIAEFSGCTLVSIDYEANLVVMNTHNYKAFFTADQWTSYKTFNPKSEV